MTGFVGWDSLFSSSTSNLPTLLITGWVMPSWRASSWSLPVSGQGIVVASEEASERPPTCQWWCSNRKRHLVQLQDFNQACCSGGLFLHCWELEVQRLQVIVSIVVRNIIKMYDTQSSKLYWICTRTKGLLHRHSLGHPIDSCGKFTRLSGNSLTLS